MRELNLFHECSDKKYSLAISVECFDMTDRYNYSFYYRLADRVKATTSFIMINIFIKYLSLFP